MSIFRRNTIFHAEEAIPDPDDLKLRFRRRVLGIAFLGFLIILGFPVLKELAEPLHLRNETRQFAEWILETRLLASKNRMPVSLKLNLETKTWSRIFHPKNSSCESESFGPNEIWNSDGLDWQFNLQKVSGETVSGHSLCLDPQIGLLLDSQPVGEGKLLVTVKSSIEGKIDAHLLISSHGSDIQALVN